MWKKQTNNKIFKVVNKTQNFHSKPRWDTVYGIWRLRSRVGTLKYTRSSKWDKIEINQITKATKHKIRTQHRFYILDSFGFFSIPIPIGTAMNERQRSMKLFSCIQAKKLLWPCWRSFVPCQEMRLVKASTLMHRHPHAHTFFQTFASLSLSFQVFLLILGLYSFL